MKPLIQNAILCYVDHGWAYFTTQPLGKQTGDDWNDVPYEHNAGAPYEPTIFYTGTGPENDPACWNADGSPKWVIVKVAFEGPFDEPSENHSNSPFSVDMINAGAIAWLRTSRWANESINIPAGTSLKSFIELVKKAGGKVYAEISWEETPSCGEDPHKPKEV